MLDQAVRDGSWEQEVLGQEVRRFLLYLRNTRDVSHRTLEDYESVLARFTAEHAHLELADFEGALGAERVLEFVATHWGAAAPGTRRKVLAIFASFFGWAARFDGIVSNPMGKIDRPRRRGVERHAHSIAKVKAIIAAQPDSVTVLCSACWRGWDCARTRYGCCAGAISTSSGARFACAASAERSTTSRSSTRTCSPSWRCLRFKPRRSLTSSCSTRCGSATPPRTRACAASSASTATAPCSPRRCTGSATPRATSSAGPPATSS
jgi:hypothetical protein